MPSTAQIVNTLIRRSPPARAVVECRERFIGSAYFNVFETFVFSPLSTHAVKSHFHRVYSQAVKVTFGNTYAVIDLWFYI